MSDILENGPRGPRSPLWYVLPVALAVAAVVALVLRGHHRTPAPDAAEPTPTPGPAVTAMHRFTGVPMNPALRAQLLLGGGGLTVLHVGTGHEQRIFTLNLQELLRGDFVTQLVALHGGVAAVASGEGGTVLFVPESGAVRTIAQANAITADADPSRLWLIDPVDAATPTATRVTLIDQQGRVVRQPRTVPMAVYGATASGLVGYSERTGTVQLWNPATGAIRQLRHADSYNIYLDGLSDAVTWTDAGPTCGLRCVYLTRTSDGTTRSFTLPSGYSLDNQTGGAAMSPDGRYLAVVVSRSLEHGAQPDSRRIMLLDLSTGHATPVPGTKLGPDADDVRISLDWQADSKTLWVADSDDPDGLPAQIGRWPLSGPLQLLTTHTPEVGNIVLIGH